LGYNCTSKSLYLADQSSPTFFVERGSEHCSVPGFQILNISIRFGDICTQSGKVSEIVPNLASFSPQFFCGGGSGTPKFLDRHL